MLDTNLSSHMIGNFLKRFYLFIHERQRERGRDLRQREKQAPCREPDVGLNFRSKDHALSQRQALNRWATQGSPTIIFKSVFNSNNYFLNISHFLLHFFPWKFTLGIPGWCSGLAPAFGPGRDPGDPGSSPTSGSLHGACFSLCLCLCLSLCISQE